MNIMNLTAVELSEKIKLGELTVEEAAEATLASIRKKEGKLHSYITVEEDKMRRQARQVQSLIEEKKVTGPLAGVPVAIKDNICTAGIRTTCASKILENFIPTYTATAVERLKRAGAVLIGKTNMDEFGMGSTTETSAFGSTKNPWNLSYVPGGSSGGAAAAVAANECIYALGTDTGGSIRQPSSFCGVVGVKPTYGTVSRYGLIAYASSMDQIGPIAKDVTDCANILEVISSYDEKDSTSMKREKYDFTTALKNDVKGIRIGVPINYLDEGLDLQIEAAVREAIHILRERGAIIEFFSLKLADYAVPAYYVIASAEASSNLARFDGVKYGYRVGETEGLHTMYQKSRSEGFGTETKRRIMLGSFVLSSGYYDAYYLKALKTKALLKKEFDEVFQKYDVLLGPVTPTVAPKIGESLRNPIQMYLGDICTVSANLAGLPALSVPCGMSREGLPIGLQIIADCFQEKKMFQVAYAYEQSSKIKNK